MEPPLLGRFVHSLVTVTSSIRPLWTRGPIASFILWLSVLQKISPRHTPVKARTGGGVTVPTHSQTGNRRMCVANSMLRPLYLQERPGIHPTRVWVGLGAALEGTEYLATHWDLIPGQPRPQRPAIPTKLFRSTLTLQTPN
jgi:hypothetical protein